MEDINITDSSSFLKINIIETLRTVPDPELNVNIIDLGLVYGVEVNEQEKMIRITMTLSSKHCPMGEAILSSVENALNEGYAGYKISVVLTWEPEWNYDKISEEGLRKLRGY